MYPASGYLKIISDSRIRKTVSNGPKNRFPSYVDINRLGEVIVSASYEFSDRWCKQESVEFNASEE